MARGKRRGSAAAAVSLFAETPISRRVLALHGPPPPRTSPLFAPVPRIDLGFVVLCSRELPRADGRPWTANGAAWALAYALRAAGVAGSAGSDRTMRHQSGTPVATRLRMVELAGEGYDAEQIAEILDGERVPTPRGGLHWSPATVDYQVSLVLGRWLPHWR